MSRVQTIAKHYEKEDKKRLSKLKSWNNLNIERREQAPEDSNQNERVNNNMRYFSSDNQQSNGNQQQSSSEESE